MAVSWGEKEVVSKAQLFVQKQRAQRFLFVAVRHGSNWQKDLPLHLHTNSYFFLVPLCSTEAFTSSSLLGREREQPPRFAQPGSFEYEYAMRWKALIEMEKQQQEQVDRNIKEAREKLEMEMEAARHEHQVMLMRQGTGPT